MPFYIGKGFEVFLTLGAEVDMDIRPRNYDYQPGSNILHQSSPVGATHQRHGF